MFPAFRCIDFESLHHNQFIDPATRSTETRRRRAPLSAELRPPAYPGTQAQYAKIVADEKRNDLMPLDW
jgi:hypothetical protein